MAAQYLAVTWNEYHTLSQTLADNILRQKISLDEIVAIARGGLSLGLILTDFLRIPISTITIQSYTDIKKQGLVQITSKLGKTIRGKNILLVDDIADSGKTFLRAISYLKRHNAAKILTASLFYKPHSRYKPDFFAQQTSDWILLPHEVTEWITTFTKKMGTEGKTKAETQTFLLSLGYTDDQIAFVKKYYSPI